MKHTPQTTLTPRTRIQELGTTMREAFLGVLAQVGGTNVRPVVLARTLKLDDSLTARLLRSVRASDPLSVLRELPAPQGLGLFLEAAARAGVGTATLQPAERAVRSFEALLGEMSLGRASLDTAIDGWLPSGRARAERASKQTVFKALSQTLGYTVDTACFAMAIQPSASGECCDSMSFLALHGIRRLREGAPILLFASMRAPAVSNLVGKSGIPPQIMETLDGEREVTDARKLLLADVGESEGLPVRLLEHGPLTRVFLDSSMPPLNVPITAAIGQVARNSYLRYATGDIRTEAFCNATKIPIRALVQDLFIHEDVYASFAPNIVGRMDALNFDPFERNEEALEVDRLDLDLELVRLGWGLGSIGVKEWGGYEPALRRAFRRAGWEADRFRAFRCYVRYPFPFVSMTTWLDLPARP